jgi:hypothetical protein
LIIISVFQLSSAIQPHGAQAAEIQKLKAKGQQLKAKSSRHKHK